MQVSKAALWIALGAALPACTFITGKRFEEALKDLDQDHDGVTVRDGDCNDDPAKNGEEEFPGNPEEPYDGWDDDCDGGDVVDADGDKFPGILKQEYTLQNPDAVWPQGVYPNDLDCNDNIATISPGGVDAYYDGVDANCDGKDDFDQDGDGFAYAAYADVYDGPLEATDCDDLASNVNTDQTTDAFYDGKDANCDGANEFDADDDDYMIGGRESQFVTWVGKYIDAFPQFEVDYGTTQTEWEDHYAEFSPDCDDDDNTISKGSTEIDYDGIDQHCDDGNDGPEGNQINDFDHDNDGFFPSGHRDEFVAYLAAYDVLGASWPDNYGGSETARGEYYDDHDNDCNDDDPAINPGELELIGDTTDQDCDAGDDSTPFGFGDSKGVFDWEAPRPPVFIYDGAAGNVMVLAVADYFFGAGIERDDTGIVIHFIEDAGSGAEPEDVATWQGTTSTHPPLGLAVDAAPFSTGALAATSRANSSGSSSFAAATISWTGSAYSKSGLTSPSTETITTYEDVDVQFDGTNYWVGTCHSSDGILLAGYDAGGTHVSAMDLQDVATGGNHCFFQLGDQTASGNTEFTVFSDAGNTNTWEYNGSSWSSVGSVWSATPYSGVDSHDGWLIFPNDGGGLDLVWDDATGYTGLLGAMDVIGADAVFMDRDGSGDDEVYIAAAVQDVTADGLTDLVLAYGDPSGSLTTSQIPVAFDGEVLNVTSAAILAVPSNGRLAIAVTWTDASASESGMAWIFLG